MCSRVTVSISCTVSSFVSRASPNVYIMSLISDCGAAERTLGRIGIGKILQHTTAASCLPSPWRLRSSEEEDERIIGDNPERTPHVSHLLLGFALSLGRSSGSRLVGILGGCGDGLRRRRGHWVDARWRRHTALRVTGHLWLRGALIRDTVSESLVARDGSWRTNTCAIAVLPFDRGTPWYLSKPGSPYGAAQTRWGGLQQL